MHTKGKITYNKIRQCWDIKTEPHIAIRLKRVFGKMNTWQYGTLSISATPENCRDLEWFLERYPMEVYPTELLAERANVHKERQAVVEQLLAGRDQHFELPPLKGVPREYQKSAAHMWLTTKGLLLADDVGLGKTFSSICGFNTNTLPALVVSLSHMPLQWEQEIKKFSNLTTHILRKGTPYDILKYTGGKLPDVIITNYHKLAGWAETLAPVLKAVVFDECQELRHNTSQKYKAAEHLAHSVEYRLGTSATPIFNYGGEIWNVMNILCPDVLGTAEEFEREWCTRSYDKPKIKDPAAFGLYARESGLMLRRTRKDVQRELPEVTNIVQKVEITTDVLAKVKGEAIELAKLIVKQKQDFKGQKMQAAGEFDMKLRQQTGIAKAPFVADFVRMLVEQNDERVVVGAWHREVYDILMERLRDLNPVMYTGSESPHQKEISKQKFIKGESKVMLISLRAGAGMDGLQDVCHLGVYAELDWSPGVHKQFTGRIHRDGQDEPVAMYWMLSDQGSDPVMSDVLGIKAQQVEGIINPNADLMTELQVDDEYIKKMATNYLTQHGVEIPQPEPETEPELTGKVIEWPESK